MEKNKIYSNMGLIVALGQNREIGYQNKLIWPIKEDLAYFKNTTMGSTMIMGRNTYESMPKNLSGRDYLVLSSDPEFILPEPKIVCHNVSETLGYVENNQDKSFWVVGGASIYQAFMPYVETMHLTQIADTFADADTYFPDFNLDSWDQIPGEMLVEGNISYQHLVLKRKKEANNKSLY